MGVGIDKGVCQLPAPSYDTGEPGYAAFKGVVDFSEGNTLTLGPGDGTAENSTATLTLDVSANGDVTGQASIYIENPRIAGHDQCEWLSARFEIDLIVGKLAGQDNLEIQAQGIGKGQYTDIHGGTYGILVSTHISAYDENY